MSFGNILWTVAGKVDQDEHLRQPTLENGDFLHPKVMEHQIDKRNTGKNHIKSQLYILIIFKKFLLLYTILINELKL